MTTTPIIPPLALATTLALGLAAGCARPDATARPRALPLRRVTLPGAPAGGGVSMDYLAYDRAHGRVWAPAGNTGSVAVVDVASGALQRIDGFATTEVTRNGQKRRVGPSSATVGDGLVYVGNRGDSSICAFDAATLQRGACATLDSTPDGLAWVAATREIWATTPRDRSITVLDGSIVGALGVKAKIRLDGEPEGYAVDDEHGRFYTNLEDADRTLAIDLKTRQVVERWAPGCGDEGPRGLALDRGWSFLVVACSDRIKLLDAGHAGKELAALGVGAGVDDLDYVEARHALYVAAARAATLTIADVGASGTLTRVATVATVRGARNGVVSDDGTTWLTDGAESALLVVPAVRR